MSTVYTSEYASPIGALTLASDGESLIGAWFAGQKYYGSGLTEPFERNDGLEVLRRACTWLDDYFAGNRPSPDRLPLGR